MIRGIAEKKVQIFNSIFFSILFNFNIYCLFAFLIVLFIEKLFDLKRLFKIKQYA